MIDLRTLLRNTAALTALACAIVFALGEGSLGLVVGVTATFANFAVLKLLVDRIGRSIASGETSLAASLGLAFKLPITVVVLWSLGSWFGAVPVMGGFALVVASFTVAVFAYALSTPGGSTPFVPLASTGETL